MQQRPLLALPGLLLAVTAATPLAQESIDPVPVGADPRPALRVSRDELGNGFIYVATEEFLAFADVGGFSVYDPKTGAVYNQGLEPVFPLLSQTIPEVRRGQGLGGTFVFEARESTNGRDLNGDGDLADYLVMAYRFGQGITMADLDLPAPVGVGLVTEDDVLVTVPEGALGLGDVHGNGTDQDPVLVHWNLDTGALTVLDYVAERVLMESGRAAFRVPEELVGDRNGDGDATDLVLYFFDPATGAVFNSHRAVSAPRAEEDGVHLGSRWEAFRVSEAGQGVDLNGDGDTLDEVLSVVDLQAGTRTSLGIASAWNFFNVEFGTFFPGFALGGDHLAFLVLESEQGGTDLNGDGDAQDRVLFTRHLPSGTTRNWRVDAQRFSIVDDLLVLTIPEGHFTDARPAFADLPSGPLRITAALGRRGAPVVQADRTFYFAGSELRTSVDWNLDGDTNDIVPIILDPATGEFVAVPHGIEDTTLRSSGDRILFGVSESADGVDWTGDGTLNDTVLGLYDPRRGDLVLPGSPFTYIPVFGPYLEPIGRRSVAVLLLEGSIPFGLKTHLSVLRLGP